MTLLEQPYSTTEPAQRPAESDTAQPSWTRDLLDPVDPATVESTSPLLEVVGWPDSGQLQVGHDARSFYVERYWLGMLGPSSTWMLRRFARGLEDHPGGFRINLIDTAKALGLGTSLARNSSTQRSIDRLCQFNLAERVSPTRLSVRTVVPTMTRKQLSKLPESVQRTHDQLLAREVQDPELSRAVAAATGLIGAGLTNAVVESQLRVWGFPPVCAHHATALALAEGWAS